MAKQKPIIYKTKTGRRYFTLGGRKIYIDAATTDLKSANCIYGY